MAIRPSLILSGAILLAACGGEAPAPDAERIKADLIGHYIGLTGDADACRVGWMFRDLEEFTSFEVRETTRQDRWLVVRADMVTDVPAGTLTADLVVLYDQAEDGWAYDSVFSPDCSAERRAPAGT